MISVNLDVIRGMSVETTAVEECLPFSADIVGSGLTNYAADGTTLLGVERQHLIERQADWFGAPVHVAAAGKAREAEVCGQASGETND